MNEMYFQTELPEDYSRKKYEVTAEELERRYGKIRSSLAANNLNPKKITSAVGPVITVFRVTLDRKMKMSELKELAFDVEFALNIRGASVKARAGGFDIEIRNEHPCIVQLKDIINSDEFRNTDYRLPITAGVDVAGTLKIIDLAEAPNILVGGSVRQGKTTALASMILSLMYAKSPEDVRFILIDPTMAGLTVGFAKLHNHKGICSESEWRPIKRDIELVRKTTCKYHVCHISTKESVELIRQAKKEGLPVTCETAPHYLVLDDMCLKEEGRFKMNPPIRSKEDKKALIEGLKDGTIDMIATDHAPHSKEEKSKGLEKSLMGVVGLEVSFPVLYTNLVKTGIITLEKLIELMNTNPRKIFGIGTEIKVGQKADISIFDLNKKYNIDSNTFLSKGKSTPFDGEEVFGECKMTIVGGKVVYNGGITNV